MRKQRLTDVLEINRITKGIGGRALHLSASHVKHHHHVEPCPSTHKKRALSDWVHGSLVLRWKPLQGTAMYEEVECWLKSTGLESEDLVSGSMSSTYNLCKAGQDHLMSGLPCSQLWSEGEQMISMGASQNRSTIVGKRVQTGSQHSEESALTRNLETLS